MTFVQHVSRQCEPETCRTARDQPDWCRIFLRHVVSIAVQRQKYKFHPQKTTVVLYTFNLDGLFGFQLASYVRNLRSSWQNLRMFATARDSPGGLDTKVLRLKTAA